MSKYVYKRNKIILFCLFFIFCFFSIFVYPSSIVNLFFAHKKKFTGVAALCAGSFLYHRYFMCRDSNRPAIAASWYNTPNTRLHIVSSAHLRSEPFFDLFDFNFLLPYTLSGNISYRHNQQIYVQASELEASIIQLLEELALGRRSYSDFIVLKKVDFSVSRCCGSLILKFKKHPFVLKLFIEKPESLLHPFQKGIFSQSFFHYVMGYGMSRHLNGFTRIKNLYTAKAAIAVSPQWRNCVTFPRKWFWLPPAESQWNRWIAIQAKNLNTHRTQTCIPAVYGIIADFIDMEKFSWFNATHRKKALELCNCVQMNLDQNVNNFAFEKQTGKIVIVDTEHFPSLIGWSGKPYRFSSYPAFWLTLGWKITKDLMAYILQIKTNPAQ